MMPCGSIKGDKTDKKRRLQTGKFVGLIPH